MPALQIEPLTSSLLLRSLYPCIPFPLVDTKFEILRSAKFCGQLGKEDLKNDVSSKSRMSVLNEKVKKSLMVLWLVKGKS